MLLRFSDFLGAKGILLWLVYHLRSMRMLNASYTRAYRIELEFGKHVRGQVGTYGRPRDTRKGHPRRRVASAPSKHTGPHRWQRRHRLRAPFVLTQPVPLLNKNSDIIKHSEKRCSRWVWAYHLARSRHDRPFEPKPSVPLPQKGRKTAQGDRRRSHSGGIQPFRPHRAHLREHQGGALRRRLVCGI